LTTSYVYLASKRSRDKPVSDAQGEGQPSSWDCHPLSGPRAAQAGQEVSANKTGGFRLCRQVAMQALR
jgi:hypothetical protein